MRRTNSTFARMDSPQGKKAPLLGDHGVGVRRAGFERLGEVSRSGGELWVSTSVGVGAKEVGIGASA